MQNLLVTDRLGRVKFHLHSSSTGRVKSQETRWRHPYDDERLGDAFVGADIWTLCRLQIQVIGINQSTMA